MCSIIICCIISLQILPASYTFPEAEASTYQQNIVAYLFQKMLIQTPHDVIIKNHPCDLSEHVQVITPQETAKMVSAL